ncbi:MAG: aldo/keto reductase [Anaerolineae bacterium]
MQYRKLGWTDEDVSVIALGCWALGGDAVWGPQDERESIATIHAALDLGVNLLDTAEIYGDGASETVVGKALLGRRDRVVLATKVRQDHAAPDQVLRACEGSLRRLQTDHIDLYQLHWPSREAPLAETVRALQKLQEQGKVRAIGVCNFGVQDMAELLTLARPAANQLPYSLLWRAIEFGIQETCVAHDIGMLCYSPLAQGLLTGKFASIDEVPEERKRTRHYAGTRAGARHGEPGQEQELFAAVNRVRAICEDAHLPMAETSLAWLLAQPAVTSVLAGARRPDQIAQNVRAAEVILSDETLEALTQATEALKLALGPNADQYQSESRMR